MEISTWLNCGTLQLPGEHPGQPQTNIVVLLHLLLIWLKAGDLQINCSAHLPECLVVWMLVCEQEQVLAPVLA